MSYRSLVCVGLSLASALLVPALAGAQSRPAAAAPTFSKDVAPIFYKNCTVCHRPGEIGPFSMLTYTETRPWVKAIATQVSSGTMPPWHADPAYSTFANDRRLSDADKDTILKWVAAGAPEGNRADLPAAPTYPSGWAIGQPDAVFQMTESYPVPASGTIDYKHFEVPTNLTEDKWIQAFEFKPEARSVVHHIIVYARPPRRPAPAAAAAPPAAPPAAGAPRPTPPFTMASGMNTPAEHRTAMAKQATANDRPVPKEGMGAFVGGFAPGPGNPRLPGGHRDEAACRIDADLPGPLHRGREAGQRPVEDRIRLGEVGAEAGIDHGAARQRQLHAAGGLSEHAGRRADDLQHGHDTLEHPAAHARSRQRVEGRGHLSRRPERSRPRRTEVRLQLADRLCLQGTAQAAEGHEPEDACVVRQLDPQQVES